MRMSRVTIGPNYSVLDIRRYCTPRMLPRKAVYRSRLLREACYLPFASLLAGHETFRCLILCSRSTVEDEEDAADLAVICRCERKRVQMPRIKGTLRTVSLRICSICVRERLAKGSRECLLFALTLNFLGHDTLRLYSVERSRHKS